MQTEIQNKEKILTELMTRILKTPLDPIDKSIKTIQSDLLDTQDRLKTIDGLIGEALAVVIEELDKASKHSRKVLTKIQEDIQALNFQLKEHVSMTSEDQRRVLEAVIAEHAIQINSALKSISDYFTKELSNTTVNQRETLSSISRVRQEMLIAIESINAAQSFQIKTVLQEIKSAKEFSEKGYASLANQIENLNGAATAKLDTISTDTRCTLTEQKEIKQEISELIKSNHAATSAILVEQQAALQTKISKIQCKLNNQAIITGIFFLSMLTYIGFDFITK